MTEADMRRSLLSPERYDYLSADESKLYDDAIKGRDAGEDVWTPQIVNLLLRLASGRMAAHAASKY